MRYFVYTHTCPNGKKYVGTTTQDPPEQRWLKGKGYYRNAHFFKAILKYGWDNITHEVFEVESEEEMYRQEINLIKLYQSNNPEFGYNNSTGGELSARGCKRSEEHRKKISESKKGKHLSEEHRRKLSEAKKGRVSPRKGCKLSEETKKKLSEAWKGRKHTWGNKISEAKKGKPNPHAGTPRPHLRELNKKKLV